jgi:Bacterial mobilisation protein (MobC)
MERIPEDKDKLVKDRRKYKGGAPIKAIKREAFIMVRLTATERMFIAGKAKRAGMKLSDWFRAAAKPEDRRILHMLAGAANNLNQLTKLAHTGGILSIARKCNELLIEIDQALKYLNADDRQDT